MGSYLEVGVRFVYCCILLCLDNLSLLDLGFDNLAESIEAGGRLSKPFSILHCQESPDLK